MPRRQPVIFYVSMVTISLFFCMDESSVKQYAFHVAYIMHLQFSLVQDLSYYRDGLGVILN